jgi:hypothetical protein
VYGTDSDAHAATAAAPASEPVASFSEPLTLCAQLTSHGPSDQLRTAAPVVISAYAYAVQARAASYAPAEATNGNTGEVLRVVRSRRQRRRGRAQNIAQHHSELRRGRARA